MWLSKNIVTSFSNPKAEKGSVTLSTNELEASSTVSQRNIENFSPYGYSSSPPVGETVMIIPSNDGGAVVGTLSNSDDIESGEVKITSLGGATIILHNDGSITLNSLKIDRNGEIVND